MNFDQARLNMVEQQVRTWDVLDATVLDVIGRIAREDFVPAQHRKLAYADLMLPLGRGQVMLKPVVEGRVLQAMNLSPEHRVLEIGTGCGYLTACIATLSQEVDTVEIFPDFQTTAESRLRSNGFKNVRSFAGDALLGWTPDRDYDVIVVSGSAASVPERFLSWLSVGGRLVAFRGFSPVMEAVAVDKTASGWTETSLFETDIPRLIGAEDAATLDF